MRVPISVELVTYTPDAEKHIERCGREAYGSPESSTIEGTRKWIQARIAGWEHDVLEHAVATFHITCSRVVSHELVRHRIASYTQRSMRFSETAVNDFIIPPEVGEEWADEWAEDYSFVLDIYNKWRKRFPRQTARYHISHAAATSIQVTMNFRELRHLIVMRAAKMAQPEMREIATHIWQICQDKWPSVFSDLGTELQNRGWI